MDDNGKRTAKAPALFMPASFVIVVAGMKGGEFHPGSLFFSRKSPSVIHWEKCEKCPRRISAFLRGKD